ncbi:pheromone A receptor-domain-containing protein [Abortiporus biennis]|nr:pheromone A receptor-domain-containing protein [Abortiporus biennis]
MIPWETEQPVLIAFSFITFILVSIPTWWMVDAGNVGGLLYIWWTATLNLIQFIDMIIWKDTALNYAPGWCDFVVRYMHIGTLGQIVAGLVIARRTCLITHGFNTLQMWPDKRREVLVDLAIGLSIPAVQLILFWFMQGHRFDIIGGIGCARALPVSILFITLYATWPIIIGIVSAVYASEEIAKLLVAATDSNLSAARYYRLIVLCAGEVLCTIPLGIFIVVFDIRHVYYPWRGFADLHSGFDRVDQYPTDLWLTSPWSQFNVEWQSWISIALGLYFFAVFGFSTEAMKHYEKVVKVLLRIIGLPPGLFRKKKDVDIQFARDVTTHNIGDAQMVTVAQDNSVEVDENPSNSLENNKVNHDVELDVTVESKTRDGANYIDIPLFNATYAFVLSNSPREIIFTVLLLLTNAKS